MNDEAAKVVETNLDLVMNDPGPPRLRYDIGLAVVAKAAGSTLLVGFGPFGTGRMWCRHETYMEELPGWADSPTVVRVGKEKP